MAAAFSLSLLSLLPLGDDDDEEDDDDDEEDDEDVRPDENAFTHSGVLLLPSEPVWMLTLGGCIGKKLRDDDNDDDEEEEDVDDEEDNDEDSELLCDTSELQTAVGPAHALVE